MDNFNPDVFKKPIRDKVLPIFRCEVVITNRDNGTIVLDNVWYFNAPTQILASDKCFRYFAIHYNPSQYRIDIRTSLPIDN